VNYRAFYILNFAVFTGMLGIGIVIPFLPIYAKTLGATAITIGVFFASFPLAQMLFMPLISRWSDRHGRKWFIATGLLLSSLLSLWYVYAPTIGYLIVGRFIQGGLMALVLPIATAYVGDLVPPQQRGRYMGIFNLFLTSSFGMGPLAGGLISDRYGMAASFYWMGSLTVLAFFAVLFFLPESHGNAQAKTQPTSYRQLLQRPKVQGLALYRMVNSIQMGLWFSFLPLLAAEILHLSKSQIGAIIATHMLVSSLVQVPAGRWADRMSRRVLVSIGGYLGSIAFLTVFYAQGFVQLLIIGTVTGAMGAVAMPALTALAADEGQDSGMGAIMGVLNMAMSVGMMLGPVLAGTLAEFFGLRLLFIFGAVVGMIGTLAFARLSVEHAKHELGTPELRGRQTELSVRP
jgi:MFS transporter, DHA1 family, multidrug resistance protein